MPEVFRAEGYVFFFYSNEGHEPLHVHVRYAGGYAKFWLVPICLAHADNMKVQELAKAEEMIAANEGKIRRRWNEVFGARG